MGFNGIDHQLSYTRMEFDGIFSKILRVDPVPIWAMVQPKSLPRAAGFMGNSSK